MNAQELWENGLVQIGDQVFTEEVVRNLNRYPGTPHANREPLPICHLCPQEVKPGEDYCWSCLGETQEDLTCIVDRLFYPSGPAIAQQWIRFIDNNNPYNWYVTRTDSVGKFTVNLRQGTYSIEFGQNNIGPWTLTQRGYLV